MLNILFNVLICWILLKFFTAQWSASRNWKSIQLKSMLSIQRFINNFGFFRSRRCLSWHFYRPVWWWSYYFRYFFNLFRRQSSLNLSTFIVCYLIRILRRLVLYYLIWWSYSCSYLPIFISTEVMSNRIFMFGRQTDTIAYFFDRFSDFHWLCLYYFGFSDETTWSFLWEGWKRARLNFNRFIPSNILICLQILGIDSTESIIFIRIILLLVKRVWRMRLLLFFFILLLFCFCKINSNFKTQM